MKNLFPYCFIFLFLQAKASAQINHSKTTDSLFVKFKQSYISDYSNASRFYLINWRNEKQPPFRVIRNITNNLYIVEIVSQSQYDSLSIQSDLVQANSNWKLSPAIALMSKYIKDKTQKFILSGLEINSLLSALHKKSKDFEILLIDRISHSAVIKTTFAYVQKELLRLNELIFVDIAAEPRVEANIIGYNRTFHGINAVDYLLPNANGKGIIAGVKEQKMNENDIDLWKRVLSSPLAAPSTSQHATVIASIIGGAGNSSYQGRGIAWGCQFFPSSFSNLFADDEAVLTANKVTVQNHSYGTIIQQYYGAEALSYDLLTWNNKSFIPVISAGNQGEASATEGQYANIPGFANLTGNFKMAKNIITVGAIDNKGTIAAQSSAGPVYDGRLAPHLIALGPNGTSDAAAVVTGTIAVMQQVYADSNSGTIPPASLIKAVLFNTAEDIYKPGIDYKTGYGLLDSYAAVTAIMQRKFDGSTLSDGQEWTKSMILPTGIHSFKVTLSWTDSAASVNNNRAIINDLDLEVVEMATGSTYHPWTLNATPNKDSLEKLPVRKRDSLNTAEQVTITLPAPGSYQIKVKGTQLASSALPFHIAFKTDTLQTFYFTSPLHASDFERGGFEPVTIRWKTFMADTSQTGNLHISYDNGTTWEILMHSVKLITGQYIWQVKDTNSIAMLKMETPFGQFLSNRFVINKPTRLNLDFNCADSFRLSWNRHMYADAYKIYTLTENPYLEPVLTVTDTFAVLQKNTFQSRVYAVEPLLNNGISAARSGAIDLDLQGVQCFYRTIYYNLLDGNRINTNLQLSTTAYVDSVFFENVTIAGQMLQTYGRVKVVEGNLMYTSLMEDAPAGITYIRGKIKLKNGTTLFTEIIPVLTSGKKSIWFYPNPAQKTIPIKYVIKQGVPASSSLQLFDANGRLLRSFAELPNQIDASGLPAGLIIYKLLDSENKVLETGKLVIY
ncbi:MAG TPA: S8 family serine peptidase [Flavisolibacter sp.]|nr:S8 family serine peptidase [Flavisolibacter sp.]